MAWRAKASSTSRTEATLCLTMLELRVGIALGSTIFLTSAMPTLGSKWRELGKCGPSADEKRGRPPPIYGILGAVWRPAQRARSAPPAEPVPVWTSHSQIEAML